jgi:Tetratricopeptide repeat
MNLPSCTTPSDIRILLLCTVGMLSGCATKRALPSAPKASTPTVSQSGDRPTMLNVEYGNAASHASIQVDLQSNDVYVEMNGTAPRKDTVVRTASPPAIVPIYMPQLQNGAQNVTGAGSNTVRTDSVIRREETRTIVEASARDQKASRDTVTARVVASIRKAQDAFYQGRYADAQSMAQRSIDDHATPEAHALAGSIAWVQKDYALARKQWQAALALDPEFPGVSAMIQKLPSETTP